MTSQEEKGPTSVPIPRMNSNELKDFILGYCDRRIFTSADCRDDEITRVFMVLLFMEDTGSLKEVGCVWEHMNEAGPLSCNGKPMFISCHLMHKKDWDICCKAIGKELKRRENIQLDVQLDLEMEEKDVSRDPEAS